MDTHQFFVHVPVVMLPELLPSISRLPVGLELLVDHEALAPGFRPQLERLTAELNQLGRPCKFHAPFRNLAPGGHDPEVVALSRRRLSAALELAPSCGVSTLVAHTAWNPDAYALEAEEWLDRSEAFWRPLGDLAESAGIRFALENVFDRDPEILAALLARLPDAPFGVTFDIGHWHAYSQASLTDWFSALGERIFSLHLHDNHGRADEHLAIGAGSIPWREFYAQVRDLEHPCEWTVENRSLEDVLTSAARLARESEIPEFIPLKDLSALAAELPRAEGQAS